MWKSGFYQGTPRAINKDFSTCAVYVNVGLFKKAGLSLPKEGWTYDDYLRLAQQLTLDNQGRNAADPQFDASNIVQYGTTDSLLGEQHPGLVPRLPEPPVLFRRSRAQSGWNQGQRLPEWAEFTDRLGVRPRPGAQIPCGPGYSRLSTPRRTAT